ncbi:PREDICTED: synaptotagmin-8, partial [Myotis brandtii]|uniref:synaptotagmin-8 n=1 Tax=Myotis brandtii TaxID=109478 RepID=UPI000704088B
MASERHPGPGGAQCWARGGTSPRVIGPEKLARARGGAGPSDAPWGPGQPSQRGRLPCKRPREASLGSRSLGTRRPCKWPGAGAAHSPARSPGGLTSSARSSPAGTGSVRVVLAAPESHRPSNTDLLPTQDPLRRPSASPMGGPEQGVEMGQPPGPPSAPAPMGTTAESGLIPDLVARIPWPRWALVAIAVATAILTASCLLCVVCCCCRRARRRKPRDKEAVGLGSVRGATTTHLVQPEVDDVESGPGGAQQWGRLQLSLEYDFGSQEIQVGLKQAVDLRARGPGGTADPYARISLSTQAGTVVMLEARGLSLELAEPYVKVQLMLNRRKWKTRRTSARKGTAAPYFNEAFTFLVPFSQIQSVDLVLAI